MRFQTTPTFRSATLVLGLHVAAVVLLPHGSWKGFLSDLAQLLASGLAAGCSYRASQRTPGPLRRLLRGLAASYGLWTTAQFLWVAGTYVFGITIGTPSPVHLLYFFAFAPLAVAILDHRKEPDAWHRGQLLDFFQVAIVLLTTYYYIFFVPHVLAEEVGRTFAYAISIRNGLLVLGLWICAAVLRQPSARRLLLNISHAFTAYSVANGLASYRIVWLGLQEPGNWHDLAWSAPFLAIAIITARWAPAETAIETAPVRLRTRSVLVVNLLPLVIPVLILALSSRIAMNDLGIAAVATAASFLCYGLKTAFIQSRQQQAVAELKATRERFQLLFARHPQPMFVFDAETLLFVEVNDAALQTYGYSREEFLRLRATDIRPAEEVQDFLHRLQTLGGSHRVSHRRHKLKSGKVIHVDVNAERLDFAGRNAVLAVAHDVTDKYLLEEKLRQTQKMEAVGTLAGGVAHDFNNLLTVIKGYSSLLLENTAQDSEAAKQIVEIDKAATRASALTRQLLAFSRKQVFHLEVLNLNQVLQNISTMLERLIGENIRVTKQLAPGLRQVRADHTQLDQVIVNLAVNARDAMPEGGDLTFETANVRVGTNMDFARYSVPAGDYVCLKVIDTGTGMDEETQSHIFEPFFTTKEQGKGTGLGLSTVYGIVKQSGGFIQVESDPGRGTTFTILLPCIEQSPAAQAEAVPGQRTRTASRTVLLVEDDEGVRLFARKVLRDHGYVVLEVPDGTQGEALCQSYPGNVDLLLTDAVMPGISGYKLAERVTRMRPSTRVLVMSGYSDDLNGSGDSRFALLQKPFNTESLIRAVQSALDEPISCVSA